jgi:hypothetical protein
MRELSERYKARLIDGIPESYLALYCPGLQGRGGTVIDRSANANNGTITGATWYRLPSGLWVHKFGTTDTVINFGKTASLNALTGNCTFEAWINPTSLGENNLGCVFNKAFITLNVIATVTAFFRVIVSGANKTATAAINAAPFGKWTHIAGVFNGSNVLIYTNLTLVTGDATAGPIDDHSSVNLYIGDKASSDRCFNGLIGLPRVYSRAPSLAEFTQHFNRDRHWFGV